MKQFNDLLCEQEGHCCRIILNRPDKENALSQRLISEFHAVLDEIEPNPRIKLVVIEARGEVFCAGMDFSEAAESDHATREEARASVEAFYDLLARINMAPKIIVASVQARVNAGGVGLVAASDIVVATSRASFALSEILFGLLPATVLPFLIRRTGEQPAYIAALTAQRFTAQEANELGLVDELTERPDESIRRLMIRATRLETRMIGTLKQYMRNLAHARGNAETTRQVAVDQITDLLWDPQTINGIRDFVSKGALPWEKQSV